MAVAYEARAHIAQRADDDEAFQRFAALYAEQWPGGQRRLQGVRTRTAELCMPGAESDERDMVTELLSALLTCETSDERAHQGPEFMARRMGALGGVLFTRRAGRLIRSAAFGELAKDPAVDGWANAYFEREVTKVNTEQADLDESEVSEKRTDDGDLKTGDSVAEPHQSLTRRFSPVLLAHDDEHGYALSGLIVFDGKDSAVAYPARLAAEMSRYAVELGEAEPAYLD